MSLASLGLTAVEEQVYRFLLCSPGRDPGTLGLDPAQTGAALDRLTALGVVRVDDGTLVAEPPSTSLELLAQSRISQIIAELQDVARARETFPALMADAERAAHELPPPAERLHGAGEVMDRIQQDWHLETATEVRATRGKHHVKDYPARDTLGITTLFNLRRGVRYRTLVHVATLEHPAYVAYARGLHRAGDIHRVTSDPIQKMIIYDKARAYVPLEADKPEAGALRIQDPGTVATLAELFDVAWHRGIDLELALVEEDTTYDRQLLRALLANTTDEAAARDLNVSVRTFRRHVAQLMIRLDASTRFQLAAIAKEKGWL